MAASAQDDDDRAIRDAVVRLIDGIGDEYKKEDRIIIACVDHFPTALNFHRYLGPEAIMVHASCTTEAYVVIADNVVNETRDSESPVKYRDFFTDNPTWGNLCDQFRRLKYSLIEMPPGIVKHIYKIDHCGRTIKAARKRE